MSSDFVQLNDQRTRGFQRFRQLLATNDAYSHPSSSTAMYLSIFLYVLTPEGASQPSAGVIFILF